MKVIQRKSIEAQAVELLRKEIISGALPLGARLTEMQLASDMRISRAIVRSALQQLAVEGLINQFPYVGWKVIELTARDAYELYTLRATLESLAAKLAAESIDPAGKNRLRAALQNLIDASKAKNSEHTTEADFQLHQTIVELARHSRLAELYRLVEQQVRLSIASTNALLSDLGSVVGQHEPIVEAILDGDAARAAELAEIHNEEEGRKLYRHLLALEENKDTELTKGFNND